MDEPDGDRVQVVELGAAGPAGDDEAALLEHGEVLGHAEAGHLGQRGRELAEGLAVALEQRVQQRPPVGVGQGPEHQLHLAIM